jgi:hypothetical protein
MRNHKIEILLRIFEQSEEFQIHFPFSLETDTVDGVVEELKSVIKLSLEEKKSIKSLMESIVLGECLRCSHSHENPSETISDKSKLDFPDSIQNSSGSSVRMTRSV